ncbi:MAG: response regulator transcription factor [Candidatus Nanoarchaeia archaeon]
MQNTNFKIQDRILEYLKTKEYGASSSEISKQIGHNRITVTKYLEVMYANDWVTVEDVAQARLWRVKKTDEKAKVLIVDDEPSVVELVALSLIPGKYKVLKAYSGLDALDRVYQEKPDLIILDLMMPGVDGYEVCRRLKNSSITHHIPIIILSAKGEVKDKLKGMDLGADDYITKPFDPMEMEARVNTILRRTKKDIDTHPLSRLPGKTSCNEKIQELINQGEKFYVFSYTISMLEDYKKKYGYRKTNDAISIIARALSNTIDGSEDFLYHTIADSFILITPHKKDSKKIREAFETVLPYIYDVDKEKKPLEIREKNIPLAKIKKTNDILEVIGD